jgi:hypothetical protein
MRRSWWGLALVVSFVAPLGRGQTISDGKTTVTIDPMGVIVTPPVNGLTATYGPRIRLDPRMTERFGVGFSTVNGRMEAVGGAGKFGPSGRTLVKYVSSSFTGTTATTIGKAGDLEIQHDFSFDAPTGALVVTVVLRNTGTTRMDMIFYSREWSGPNVAGGTFPGDWVNELPKLGSDVWRMSWMPNNILPGREQGCVFTLEPAPQDGSSRSGNADDVPLQRWKGGSWPNGVDYGTCWGIAFTDFDHDGFIDVYSNASRKLWQDLGGTDWSIAADLTSEYPNTFEYGSGWADYDNDQLPDMGSEPRGGCMALLHNLGAADFDNVGDDPTIVDTQPCNAESETIAVADVDGDGNLDWFLPTYPGWMGSSGNWFLYNLGPDAAGIYKFHEASATAGLDNPPFPVNRPEGAEFCDYDNDGDVDLYSNNTIYRNLSSPGTPLFESMTETGSGVIFSDILDEGARFIDYDMDGDMDLCIAFCDGNKGVRMFENKGDGTFVVQPKGLFDSPASGLCLGLSTADWDNDGDVDVTTSEVFRRNQWMETRLRHFTVATHSIPANHITDAVPSWGDFDHDGDLDSALGNWGEKGRLYENYLYGASTPEDLRRYVRVKVVRDSPDFDDGLETEYGATVTVRPIGITNDVYKRTGIVSCSGGYLNQNEYTLHFALPADPDPADPEKDLTFNVSVDFTGDDATGIVRVDKHVNPVLSDLNLARLQNREIVVYRSGRVRIDGCDFLPGYPMNPLVTTTNGLVMPTISTQAAPPAPVPGADWFVGTEISTVGAPSALRIEELIIDGKLDAAVDCSGFPANFFVWDVTDPTAPTLAQGGIATVFKRISNIRGFIGVDTTLQPDRVYRIVCRVLEQRPTPITAPVANGALVTNGGLSFQDSTPCTGAGAAAAILDPSNVYLAVRFRPEPPGAWADLGHALPGTYGDPSLSGTGALRTGDPTTVDLSNALENAPAWLIAGYEVDCPPMFKGVVIPSFDIILVGLTTDAGGQYSYIDVWPDDIAPGATFYFQMLVWDGGAPQGFAFSNALAATAAF